MIISKCLDRFFLPFSGHSSNGIIDDLRMNVVGLMRKRGRGTNVINDDDNDTCEGGGGGDDEEVLRMIFNQVRGTKYYEIFLNIVIEEYAIPLTNTQKLIGVSFLAEMITKTTT